MEPVKLLGDYALTLDRFQNLEQVLAQFDTPEFKKISARKRFRKINEILIQLIQKAPLPSFLLPAVVEYINRVNQKKILDETYHFTLFEFWLNHYSELSPQENYLVRAKIAGQLLPREDYQVFFPIGMGKSFPGTHYVTAHLSPDVDTTIASFWGWLDAFAAKVSDGLHLWSLPGGPPDSPVTQLFRDMFGQTVFSNLSRQSGTLTLSAMDLVTQKNVVRESAATVASSLDHGFNEKALILVDEDAHYYGDWRSTDVEPVRQVIILFNVCLRWFETNVHVKFISLFARESLNIREIPELLSSIFDMHIEESEPVHEFTEQQRLYLESFLVKVLGVQKGLQGSYGDLSLSLEKFSLDGLTKFREEVNGLSSSGIFDAEGNLIEERPRIFNQIQKIINRLDNATHSIRNYIERLDIGIQIKSRVLNKMPHYLTLRNDVEDIRLKMSNYTHLTVVVPEENGNLYPVGVVWANDLRKPILGTVSFRDFCNTEEVKMASYLSVISVVDHHKSSLNTSSPPLALIGDTQSCNVLVAEQAIQLNDRYSVAGMDKETISQQIVDISHSSAPSQSRLLQRLLKRRMAAEIYGGYFVHPKREMVEYLFFLHAILDDTDLLTKVSNRDVNCIVDLLNRMKSISLQKETEVISLDDLPRDSEFAKTAAKKILQNPDMYSVYKKIYTFKEKEVSVNLQACAEGHRSNIFLDTKEQNGCCRVGQTKMFTSNFPFFQEHRDKLISAWLMISEEMQASHPEIDLHMQMISTIPSAEEVFEDRIGRYEHKDELWFWIPDTEQAQHHLTIFLSAFKNAPEVVNNQMELELCGPNAEIFNEIFYRNFQQVVIRKAENWQNGLPIAILSFKAGSINSRKSMISPYLPRLVP